MKTNVGSTDKIFRVIVGLVLIMAALLITMSFTFKVILLVIGIICLFTALTGFCLMYVPLGINTRKTKAIE